MEFKALMEESSILKTITTSDRPRENISGMFSLVAILSFVLWYNDLHFGWKFSLVE